MVLFTDKLAVCEPNKLHRLAERDSRLAHYLHYFGDWDYV